MLRKKDADSQPWAVTAAAPKPQGFLPLGGSSHTLGEFCAWCSTAAGVENNM